MMFTREQLRKNQMSKGCGLKRSDDSQRGGVRCSCPSDSSLLCPGLARAEGLVPWFKSLLISVYMNIPGCELLQLRALIHDLCQA